MINTIGLRFFALLVLSNGLSVHAATPVVVDDLADAYQHTSDPVELARTWELSEVWIAGHVISSDARSLRGFLGAAHTQQRMQALPEGLKLPLVVLLHGCTGIGAAEQNAARIIVASGYAIIMPNSFARALRSRNCDPIKSTGGMFPLAYLYRRAEMHYAMDQIRTLDWVDPERVVLAGISEGAIAVALWGAEVWAQAYIVAAWTCTAPSEYRWLGGLRVPDDRPTLALVSRKDRWYDWLGWQGDCAGQRPTRGNVKSLVIDGSVHNVFVYPEAASALTAFLTGLHKLAPFTTYSGPNVERCARLGIPCNND